MMRRLTTSLLVAAATLAAVSLVAFLLCTAARGDPALLALQQDGVDPSPELLAAYRTRLGLDDPLPVRYVRWVFGIAQGDLGRSFLSNRPVSQVLGERVVPTLALGGVALAASTALGVGLGILLASWRNSALDLGVRLLLTLLASIPGFWLAIAVIVLFGERLRLLPVAGYGTWQHFVLPILALSVGPTATLVRLTRGVLLDALQEDYVRTAQAKGLTGPAVALRHLLPNVAQPILALTGVRLGHLLGGAIIVESVFAWPGMGAALIAAISGRDLPVIGGYVLITGALVITTRVLVDFLGAVIDPRTALAGGGS